jgi:drug/metabolite transporter (DMT)-like permease
MKTKYVLRGMIFLILAQTMVGVNIVSAKLLLSSIPILVILEIRFALATFILLPLHWLTPDRALSVKEHLAKTDRKDWYFILAQALTAGVLFNCLMLLGLHYTDANVAGIITSALPAIIAIMSWILLKEKISAKKSMCILFATAGLLVIAFDKLHGIGEAHSFFGDAIVLLSLIPEAIYYVLFKLHPNRLPIFLTSSLMNGINAILLLPVIFFLPWQPDSIHTIDWFILFILGLTSGLFYVFWFFGCRHVDGIMASLSTAVMPVATVLIAWLLLGEHLSGMQTAGMGLVLLSIVAYARK